MMRLFGPDIESYFEVTSTGTDFFPNKDRSHRVSLQYPEQRAMLRAAIKARFYNTTLLPLMGLSLWPFILLIMWLENYSWDIDPLLSKGMAIIFVVQTLFLGGNAIWAAKKYGPTLHNILNYTPPFQHFGLPDE